MKYCKCLHSEIDHVTDDIEEFVSVLNHNYEKYSMSKSSCDVLYCECKEFKSKTLKERMKL